jgi:tetratricopeptide (TPR) repeat protein
MVTGLLLIGLLQVADIGPTGNGQGPLRVSPSAADPAARERLGGDPRAWPEEMAAQARLGWNAYQAGDTQRATSILSAPAQHPSAPAWVHYVLGWARFAEGDIDGARGAWTRVQAMVPDFEEVYFDLADCDLRQHRPAESLAVLDKALRFRPENSDILNAIGVVETSLRQFDNAIAAFERALRTEPAGVTSRYNLARALELRYTSALGRGERPPAADLERAAAEFRRVVDAHSAHADDAGDGMRRTQSLDASRMETGPPRRIAGGSTSSIGGTPVRMAWSPDQAKLFLYSVSWAASGRIQRPAFRTVSLPDGRVDTLPSTPDWAVGYWEWKSSLSAPWLPYVKLAVETRRVFSTYTTTSATAGGSSYFSFAGTVIGETQPGSVDRPGTTFGWAPFAMAAVVFVDRDSNIVVIDQKGARHSVTASKAQRGLPAWSPDGRTLAWLETTGNRLEICVASIISSK